MAGTTFLDVKSSLAALIESITPATEAATLFSEVNNRALIEAMPTDAAMLRKFQLRSGGLVDPNTVHTNDLSRDARKALQVVVCYPIMSNYRAMEDMADDDENLIVRTLELPNNYPSYVLHIECTGTEPDLNNDRLLVYQSFLVHYRHSA